MARQFVSCPCCGNSVQPEKMNMDANGNRVAEPMHYGMFVRVCKYAGRARLNWERYAAPIHVKRAILAQLEQVLVDVRASLAVDEDADGDISANTTLDY